VLNNIDNEYIVEKQRYHGISKVYIKVARMMPIPVFSMIA
jgi:hypothetical protein